MEATTKERRWFWATLTLSSITIVTAVFALWELVENRFFRNFDYVTLHHLYITRGIASSLLLTFWAAWYVLRQRRHSEEELRRSRERYRGLLEALPGAVALYDSDLCISEWNAAAERLYGFTKAEVLGRALPIIPAHKEDELREFLSQARAGESILDVETLRRDRSGALIEVQLSLLPFREAAGPSYFLEVATDIRERARLRKTLLEVEKLTSMGKMAAGTAHHLNTPLAAMLLRVQMMREREGPGPYAVDLERLESGIHFCQQFVQRLLELARSTPAQRRPQEICATIESVVSFLAPAFLDKRARVSVSLDDARSQQVYADRNLIEVLFLILLSNAVDAIGPEGAVEIRCRKPGADRIEVSVSDNGCGISNADLPRVFEPFFTTKEPGKGTGLGLAIAWNAVQEHGGSIRLESAVGRGTTAFVELPLYQETAHRGSSS